MNKHIIILLLVIAHFSSRSQKAIITDGPCTDAMAQNVKGRLIQTANNGTYNTKEISSRIDKIHDLVLEIYPEPTGVDAIWHRTAGISYFGSKRKYYNTTDGRLTFD